VSFVCQFIHVLDVRSVFFLICTFFYNLHVSLLKCVDIKPTEQQNLVFSVPLWNLRLLVYYKFTGECALKEFLTPVNIW